MEKNHAKAIIGTGFDAVIIANGDYPSHPIARAIIEKAPFVCCCDGAAMAYMEQGRMPHAIVGDGDSLPQAFIQQHASIIHTSSEQKYNDLTKATRFCVSKGYRRIVYLACTGKREDHALGNISLMAYYKRTMNVQPIMFTDHGYFMPAQGTQTFQSMEKQQVSIFRINGETLTSEGLRWDIYPFSDWWEGTLNEAIGETFTIHSDGEYLVYQTYEIKQSKPI